MLRMPITAQLSTAKAKGAVPVLQIINEIQFESAAA
jgi:hypothetical protein